ncbi:MAG: beta-N-acetylhexosaminidase, partial [Pseudomonadota bacterium]
DLTMEGASAVGGIVERAEAALDAGCDVLPVCNRRESVLALLDGLRTVPGPASQARIRLMRGREAPGREALMASTRWRQCREWLARCDRPPELTLT